MQKLNKKGFTLLEVTLFLAISGGLAVIAIAGLGPRLNNVRFSAAMRDLESSTTSNLANATRGSNTRTKIMSCQLSGNRITIVRTGGEVEAGGSSTCVVNGVVMIFDYANGQILYRTVVSLREPVAGCSEVGFKRVLICNKATLLGEGESPNTKIYNYINGLKQTSPASNVGFGYVQDPNGTTIYPFRSTPKLLFTGDMANTLNTFDAIGEQTQVCYELGSRQAKIVFNNASLKPEVRYGEPCS